MSTSVVERPAEHAAHRTVRPSLLRAEFRRFRSRRFIRVMLGVAVLGYIAALVVGYTQYERTTPQVLAAAQQRLDGNIAQDKAFRAQCLAEPRPKGVNAAEFCGPPMSADNYGDVTNYIDKTPFTLPSAGLDGAQGVAFATAALAFLIGATFIGAEWSGRSLIALLFWEPRRRRVMTAKLTVLSVAAAVLAAVTQLAWLGGAKVLAATRGTAAVPDGFWGDYAGVAGRGIFVAVVAALLGFGIANAVRNTAAALGVGFLYFAVAESVVRAVKPAWQPWLLTDNAVAFVQHLPFRIYLNGGYTDANGAYQIDGREIVLTHLHAGLLLGAVSLAVVAIGVVLFQRRDLN